MIKKLRYLFTLMLLLVASVSWAGTITFSELGLENGVQYTDPFDGGDFTVTFAGGGNDGKYYTTGKGIRVYGNGTMTIAAKSGKITALTITYGGDDYKPTDNSVVSVGTYSVEDGTWTGNAESVVFTRPSGSGHWRVQKIVATVAVDASQVSIPTFSPAAGTYTSAQNVTITTETGGASIYYTINGDEPTANSTLYNGAINVSESTTIKAIAVKEGMTNSLVASAEYTILSLQTISEVRTQSTGSVYTKGVVTSYVGSNAYIQDAYAAICVYGSGLSIAVGDEISVQGTLSTFNGLLEITNPVVSVLSSGNTVEPEAMTIAQVKASTNQGWLIKVENANVTAIDDKNVTIAQGEDNVVVRFNNTDDITFAVNDNISLTANIGCYNGVQLANPQNIEVQQNTEPSITVAQTEVNVAAAGGAVSVDVTFENIPAAGDAGVTIDDCDWVTEPELNDARTAITFTVSPNTGEARTAELTVYICDVDENVVASKTITITQAKATAIVPVVEGCGVYQKITKASDLEAGKRYLIVYEDVDNDLNPVAQVYSGVTSGNIGAKVEMPLIVDFIDNSSETATPIVLQNANEENWYLMDVDDFLYAANANNLYSSPDASESAEWKIDFTADNLIQNIKYSERYLQYNAQSPRFACYKGTQKNVALYKELAAVTVTISAAGKATFVAPVDVDFSESDVTAYIVTYIGESSITLEEVTEVPAGAAVVVEGAAGTYEVAKAEGTVATLSDNLLKADTEDIEVTVAKTYYVLAKGNNGVGFYPVKVSTSDAPSIIAAGKGYLKVTDATAKDFYGFGGDETGINDINVNVNANDAIYSISGQRLQKLQRGINIVNGKKIVVK